MKNNNGVLIATGIFPPDIGGPASYASTIAQRLAEQNVPVCVVSYSKQFRIKEDKWPFPVTRIWSGWPIWIKHALFGIALINQARNYKTILALNVWSAGFPAWIVSKLFKKKFIVRVVGDYAWEVAVGSGRTDLLINDFQKEKRHGWIGLLSKMQKKVCDFADAIIVPSEYLSSIVQGWGVPASKIHVIYNGAEFKPVEVSKEEARKKLGITGNVILTIGRLVPWKGFRMMIKLMPKLAEINQFFKLVIVGDGPDHERLKGMIKNLGLERKVMLVGRKSQEELAWYCAAADMFVLNTGYEGFSHQILEVMIAGVPVIVSGVGGNKEIIHQGENGFMVRYNDEFNIIEAIRSLWTIPELRERFIVEGKKTATHFSVKKMFDETIKLIIHA